LRMKPVRGVSANALRLNAVASKRKNSSLFMVVCVVVFKRPNVQAHWRRQWRMLCDVTAPAASSEGRWLGLLLVTAQRLFSQFKFFIRVK
jgi:hypothetical protein